MNVDKSIPIPKSNLGAPAKYPFTKMEVGDSAFFEGEKISATCKPYVAAQVCGSKGNKKFTGRTMDGGVRIWRVS